MHILLINQVFFPDVAATAQHAHDLARHLVRSGHEVTVIASRSIYGQRGAALPPRETVDGIDVRRVGRSLFGKAGLAARAVDFGLFYAAAAVKALVLPRADVSICLTTPPFIALLGWALRVLRRSRFVYWVMDLYPDVPVGCGVLRPDAPLTRALEAVNRFCLHRADRVVVLGRCMERRVLDKGVDPQRLRRIGVWSDAEEVRPVTRAENPFREQWQLGEAFVVMYSGNFGLAHDVDTMCRAAEAMAGEPDVRFAFVGGGKRKEQVEHFVTERGLDRCVLAPYQPRERLADSLSCADVHLVSLREGLEGSIVPCKLFGIMAAARPSILIGHPESELGLVLQEHDCGLVVREGDVDGLVAAIDGLKRDPSRLATLGANARQALCDVYDRHRACEEWERMLEGVMEGERGRATERRSDQATEGS
jgi:glycosyltransferase involved in cell wall biosynthesis